MPETALNVPSRVAMSWEGLECANKVIRFLEKVLQHRFLVPSLSGAISRDFPGSFSSLQEDLKSSDSWPSRIPSMPT